MKWIAVLATLGIAGAQELDTPGSVSGVVRGESGGPPIDGISVRIRQFEAKTDSNGAYRLDGIPPGRHQMSVGFGFSSVASTTRTVSVQPGQSVRAMFSLPLKGTISGKVVDHNDEPLPGVEVVLIGREYGAGTVRHFRRNATWTDDQGEYRMQFVQPGVDYLLLFRHADPRGIKPLSNAPAEPKLRRPTFVPTYYPGSAQREGASVFNLRSAENREQVNIRLLRAPSFCVEGMLTAGGQPAAMTFHIHEAELSFGIGPSGGTTGIPTHGQSGPDGRIRICDLHPGDYRLTAFTGDINQPESISTIAVMIKDRDVRNVSVTPVPRIPAIPVEFSWRGEPPKEPLQPKILVGLRSITRSFGAFGGSAPGGPGTRLEIREQNAPGVLIDDYYVLLGGLTGRLYVNEMLYGSENVAHAALRPGSAIGGTSLRISLGHDGGLLTARAADRDSNPVPDATVIVMPSAWSSAGQFAADLVIGQADQHGEYQSVALKPGKYFVLATLARTPGLTPDFVDKVQRLRLKAQEVVIEPNATVQLKMELTEIR